MEGPSLNNSINNYRERLNRLEHTYCPTFFENLPLTIIEFIKGLISFLQKMWGAIINIPIFGAPLHLVDDLIQSVWIAGRKRGVFKFLFPLKRWKTFLDNYIKALSQTTSVDPLFPISLLLRPIVWILSVAQNSYYRQIKWKRRVFNLLIARDELEDHLNIEKSNLNHAYMYSRSLITIIRLDDRLRNQSDRIFRTRDLDKLKIFRNPEATRWWWNPTPPRDRLNWLWQLIIYTCIIGGVSLGADIASRLFTGGDFLGIVAIIGPALLALLLGKEGVSQISSGLEEALNKLDIPKRYWREFILIFAGFLLYVMVIVYQRKSDAAICYYRAGRDIAFSKNEIEDVLDVDVKTPECTLKFLPLQSQDFLHGLFGASANRKTIQAESYLKTASALAPDNAEVSFALGFLYELQQDIDSAQKQYKVSVRNGSQLARIRLAKLYLRDNKKESAALAISILVRGPELLQDSGLSIAISSKIALVSARIQQGRYLEAEEDINQIYGAIRAANKAGKIAIEPRLIASVDCLKAEILDFKKENDKASKLRESCVILLTSKDFFEDDLRGRAKVNQK
jgi:hypothetical protein